MVQNASDGDTISVFGDVDLLEVPQSVVVLNNGSGKVTVNGKNIATGKFLKTPYSILNGADQIWNGTGELIIEANGIYTELDSVTVDNKTLTEGIDYNLSDGSTIVTFTYTYLDSLSNGTYEVILTWSDGGSVSTTFTVSKSTGVDSQVSSDPSNTLECQEEFAEDYVYSD